METVTPEIIPSEEAVRENLISLQESMQNMDSVSIQTQSARNQILVKILPEVLAMDLTINDRTDAELYESKARLISETRGLLNDMDTSSRNQVNIKLKQKDIETSATAQLNVADFLSKIKPGEISLHSLSSGEVLSDQEIDAKLAERFSASSQQILDTELETGQTQLPESRTANDF